MKPSRLLHPLSIPAAALLALAPPVLAQDQAEPAPLEALTAEVAIPYESFTLDNGLTVIVHEDRKAPVVGVAMWYNVGSKDEPEGKTGFAHLFEHLMFNGSENAPGDYPLVQIFYFFFVLPLVGIRFDAFTTGCTVLALNFGAYLSEVVRSAILSVDKGQYHAAIALSIPVLRRYRRIILPQAIPVMLPAFGNYALELLKATSLVSLITITELTFSGAQLVQFYGRPTTIYLSIFFIYLILAIPLILLNRNLEKRAGGRWKAKVPTT